MTDARNGFEGRPLLDGFLALDLTSGRQRMSGSMLAHLGMRVVRPARDVAAETASELDWFENSGKELWEPAGDDAAGALAGAADVILTDGDTAERWGLTAGDLAERAPLAIVSMVTAYGMEGPKASWPAAELTVQAASGQLWMVGYEDRAPVPLPGSQAAYHGATQAVAGALGALYAREEHGGRGEIVDVSMQEAAVTALVQSRAWWYVAGRNIGRSSMSALGGQVAVRMVWPASDGYISFRIQLGVGDANRRMQALVEWMVEKDGVGQELREVRFGNISTLEVKIEDIRRWEGIIAPFFAKRTRAELFGEARRRDLLLLPVLAPAEVIVDEHMRFRQSFAKVEHAGRSFAVPGYPVRAPGIAFGRLAPHAAGSVPAAPDGSAPRGEPIDRGGPLRGIKVIDFGWAVAGPTAGRMLGLLGATVVKIETNTRIDSTRASTPFVGRPSRDRSGYFSTHNSNKLSVVLDLNKAGSRPVVERLVRWADVLNENFSAGRLEEWDLGYDRLQTLNPRLVALRSSTWGQEGPYRAVPAIGIVLAGFAGFGELMGWPDRPPLLPVEPYTDMLSPWFSISAVLAALIARGRTGEGVQLDNAQVDGALNFLAPEYIAASLGERPGRRGAYTCDPYPAGVFRAPGADEWCAIAIQGAEQWKALCTIVPGLAGDQDLPPEGIAEVTPLVFTAIADMVRSTPPDSTVDRLIRAGIPASRVERPEDLYNDPQLHYRRHFAVLPHPAMGSFPYELPAFRYRDREVRAERSPCIGEHVGLVLGDFLGFGEDEIADLYAAGVLN